MGTLILLTGIGLLVDAWFKLRPTVYAGVKHWAVLAIWSIPLLAAPPTFSHDAYSYSAQGWMLVNDVNPYDAGPGVLRRLPTRWLGCGASPGLRTALSASACRS